MQAATLLAATDPEQARHLCFGMASLCGLTLLVSIAMSLFPRPMRRLLRLRGSLRSEVLRGRAILGAIASLAGGLVFLLIAYDRL